MGGGGAAVVRPTPTPSAESIGAVAAQEGAHVHEFDDANGRRAWLARSPWYGSTLCAGGAAIEAAYPSTLGLHLPQV